MIKAGKVRLAITSAVLSTCIAFFALAMTFWVRSHTGGDTVRRYYEPAYFEAISVDGLLTVAWGQLHSDDYPPRTGWVATFWPFTRESDGISADISRMFPNYWNGFGFTRFQHASKKSSYDARAIVVPYWFISLMLVMAMALLVRRIHNELRRQKRVANGLCIGCGYDLRASKDRCPECGIGM